MSTYFLLTSIGLVGKIFCNPGDKVIVGLPSYLGELVAFVKAGDTVIGNDRGIGILIK